jgi:hypothetical protein
MAITMTPLTPCFAARIGGADITRPLDDTTKSALACERQGGDDAR